MFVLSKSVLLWCISKMAEASDSTLTLVSCPLEHEYTGSDTSEQSGSDLDLEESSDSDSDGQAGDLDETLSFITSLSSHRTPEASPAKKPRIDHEQGGSGATANDRPLYTSD